MTDAPTIDYICFKLSNNSPGAAKLVLQKISGSRTLVICKGLDELDGAPVNMAVEFLFRETCARPRLAPLNVIWVEFTDGKLVLSHKDIGGWELVTWKDKPGVGPAWRQLTAADWANFGISQPPEPE